MRVVAAWVMAIGVWLETPTLAQVTRMDSFRLTYTQESGWGTYCVLDVSGSKQNIGDAHLICHNPPASVLASRKVDVVLDAEIGALPASDVQRLYDLVSRADLFGGDHYGRDSRGGDGNFDTLKVFVHGATTILVTSSNGSFTGGHPARTQLRQELVCLEERLRVQAGKAPNPARGDCRPVTPR